MLLAVTTGIVAGSSTDHPSQIFIIGIVALPFLLLTAFLVRKQALALLASTLLAAICFGTVLISASRIQHDRSLLVHASQTFDTEIALTGIVDNVSDDGSYFRLACDTLIAHGNRQAVDGEAAGIFLRINDSTAPTKLTRGMTVTVFGDLVPLGERRNPYTFNYDEYLRANERIEATMFCDSYYDIVVRDSISSGTYDDILGFFSRLRMDAKETIGSLVSDTVVRGFLLAMVLGERKALSDEVWEDFQNAGLSHILVVSGFNLGLISWALYIVLRMLRLGRREIRIALVMIGTLCYGALIGPQPSVVRAVIVVELILIAKLLERKADLTNLTAGAALLDLVLDPIHLFDISFQLSYSAVFSLTLIAPALDRFFFPQEDRERRWYDMFTKGAIGTTAILLGTMPIVLFHFHQVSAISIVTNFLAIPLASIATILSMVLLSLAFISTWLASVYVDVVSFAIYLIRAIASFANDVPFAVIRLPHPSVIFVFVYVLSLLYIIRAPTGRMAVGRCLMVVVLTLSLTSTGMGVANTLSDNGKCSIFFFDVGQGDATLVATPNGKYYMIDGGGLTRTGKPVAERSVFPFLTAEGISHIDGLFSTHMHLDHYGGLAALAGECSVDTIYSCGGKASTAAARTLDSVVSAERLPVRYLKCGDVLRLDDEVTAYILSPQIGRESPVNERSLVMKIVYRETSFLLLADIAAETEELLVKQYGTFLQSDIVKVAHHGSRSSSSTAFIAETRPAFAVVSSGRRNRHGHPHPDVVRAWQSQKAVIARTDLEGALAFESDGNSVERIDWR